MKSSTNKFPVGFQDMKLQSIKPLKRLSRKLFQSKLLKKTRARMGQTISQKADALAKAASFSADSKAPKSSKLLLNLLLVRPWVLVVGFWLLSMGIGSLALEGMLSPRRLTMALPEPAIEEPASTQSNAVVNVEQGSDEIAADSPAAGALETAATTGADRPASRVPVLPLVSLVGACAIGSLAISRRRAMLRMASVRANKGRVRKSQSGMNRTSATRSVNGTLRASVKSVRAKSTQVVKGARSMNASARNSTARNNAAKKSATPANRPAKPLAVLSEMRLKTRRQGKKRGTQKSATVLRNGAAIAAQQQRTGSRMLASRMNAQANGQKNGAPSGALSGHAQSHRPSVAAASKGNPKRASVRNRKQPVVSVVPANEAHTLDWTQSSLAHQFDVRPHRSAM